MRSQGTASAGRDARGLVLEAALGILGTTVETSAPLMSAGLDSLATTEFVGALAAGLSADVSPTLLFDHPTLDAIAAFLAGELATPSATPAAAETDVEETKQSHGRTITAWAASLAGAVSSRAELRSLSMRAFAANARVPATRWATVDAGAAAATYGSFAHEGQL